MCNEIAILIHCRPGDEIYADKTAHIVNFEAGGPSALAGAHIHTLDGAYGIFSPAQLEASVRKPNRYSPKPRLVEIEQSTNIGGGAVWPLTTIQEIADIAAEHGMAMHMDGARLMNAVVASNVDAADYAGPFDSVWIDLSKGLGCPVGAVLAGSQAFIDQAWQWKQRIGGAIAPGRHHRGGRCLCARTSRRTSGRGPRERAASGRLGHPVRGREGGSREDPDEHRLD